MPVAFQRMRVVCELVAADGTDPALLERLAQGAEYCCIVLQTLRSGVEVSTTFEL